jgi:hypothetical protein
LYFGFRAIALAKMRGQARLHPKKDEIEIAPKSDFGGQARLHPEKNEIK